MSCAPPCSHYLHLVFPDLDAEHANNVWKETFAKSEKEDKEKRKKSRENGVSLDGPNKVAHRATFN